MSRPLLPRRLLLPLGVLLLLGLVGLVVGRAFRRPEDPTANRIHADFATVLDALERYRAAGKPLPEEGELDFLVPGYLPQVPVDPWGRPYRYSHNGREPFLATFGEDGERGGRGDQEDHTNHDGHRQLSSRPAGSR